MSKSEITTRRVGAAVVLTLSRPEKGNALSAALVEALDNAWRAAIADDARCIVIDGSGKHLCTGFDLSDLDEESEGDLLLRFVRIEQLLRLVYEAPLVTVAIGRGRIVGAGADLFSACDHRIALPDAAFSFPGAGFGLVLGTSRLAERIGRDRARDVLVSGETLSAEAALRCRLATEIASSEQVGERITMIVERAAGMAPETVAALHRATARGDADGDLAALVRSASRPGLKDRIRRHRAAMLAARTPQNR